MKKFLSIILFASIAITSNAQILWRISGNGLEKPSYILGTHHLAPLSIIDSIKGLPKALESTTQIVGEINMANIKNPDMIQLMQKEMMISSDTTLASLFNKEEFDTINKLTKKYLTLDISLTPKLKPSFLESNLMVAIYMKQINGFNMNEQLDSYFQTEGMKKGKKIIALETLEFQFHILYSSSSLKRQAEMLLCELNNMDTTLALTKELTSDYMKQDLNALLKLSEKKQNNQCDPNPNELEMTLYNRDRNWAKQLPKIMKEAPAFIAVGALHLPGDKGLLHLLKLQGYKVEPIK